MGNAVVFVLKVDLAIRKLLEKSLQNTKELGNIEKWTWYLTNRINKYFLWLKMNKNEKKIFAFEFQFLLFYIKSMLIQ